MAKSDFREDRADGDAHNEAEYAEYLRNAELRRRKRVDLSWRDEYGRVWTKPSDIFKPGYGEPDPRKIKRVR
jgi:hypothetical protein